MWKGWIIQKQNSSSGHTLVAVWYQQGSLKMRIGFSSFRPIKLTFIFYFLFSAFYFFFTCINIQQTNIRDFCSPHPLKIMTKQGEGRGVLFTFRVRTYFSSLLLGRCIFRKQLDCLVLFHHGFACKHSASFSCCSSFLSCAFSRSVPFSQREGKALMYSGTVIKRVQTEASVWWSWTQKAIVYFNRVIRNPLLGPRTYNERTAKAWSAL